LLSSSSFFFSNTLPVIIKQWEPRKTIAALRSVDLDQVKDRSHVNQLLRDAIPNTQIRMFLLTNLQFNDKSNKWYWRVNLEALEAHIEDLGGFNIDPTTLAKKFDKPVLFVSGQDSFYLQDPKYTNEIPRFFTQYKIEAIPKAGHWVHVDNPQAVLKCIREFIE